MNLWDAAILLVIALCVALAFRRIRRGKCSGCCCGDCEKCAIKPEKDGKKR